MLYVWLIPLTGLGIAQNGPIPKFLDHELIEQIFHGTSPIYTEKCHRNSKTPIFPKLGRAASC